MSIFEELKTVFFSDEFKDIPFSVRLSVYLSRMNNEYKPKWDILIQHIIDHADQISKIEKVHYTITFYFLNGTNVNCWISNLWYGFLYECSISNKSNFDKLGLVIYRNGRPSRFMILKFLKLLSQFCTISNDDIELKKIDIDEYFVFGPEEKKEESNE